MPNFKKYSEFNIASEVNEAEVGHGQMGELYSRLELRCPEPVVNVPSCNTIQE